MKSKTMDDEMGTSLHLTQVYDTPKASVKKRGGFVGNGEMVSFIVMGRLNARAV
jgi:hypothetical protein